MAKYTKIAHFNGMEKMTTPDNYERCPSHLHLSSNLQILVCLFSRQHLLFCCILASVQVWSKSLQQLIVLVTHDVYYSLILTYTIPQFNQ